MQKKHGGEMSACLKSLRRRPLKVQLHAGSGAPTGWVDLLSLLDKRHTQCKIRSACRKMALFLLTDSGRAEKACSGRASTAWKRKLQAEPATRRPWATAKNGSTAGLLRGVPGWGSHVLLLVSLQEEGGVSLPCGASRSLVPPKISSCREISTC